MRSNLNKLFFASALAVVSVTAARAQTTLFKCTVDGRSVYQPTPCTKGDSKELTYKSAKSTSITILPNGYHQYYTVAELNGKTFKGEIDTGATFVTISPALAQALNIDLRNAKEERSITANGRVPIWTVYVPVLKIGPLEAYNVKLAVAENCDIPLLGMTALGQFDMRQENGALVLSSR